VLFLRFKLGKEKEDLSLPEIKGEHKTKEVMELIKRIVRKPSGEISALTPCLATFLVGVVGGVPFVISLAIYYWNKKILSTKAIVQEQLTIVTMGSVTAICIDKTAWLTMNPQEVDERWIDETVTREDSAIPEVKEAFCFGISTSSSNDQDKCLKETIDAVRACRNAGVKIMLVSEDGESVIEDIAQKYGMLSGPGILEHGGETFRSFSDEQRKDVVNEICVMGNSLPSDKLLLVRCLKQQGHIVAFVGVRTDDAPSLKEADVGIVTGTGSSELVNGSSELIILDRSFGFLASILNGGRCINGNIHKYIQVEVTITISGLLISIVTTIIFGNAPLEAIQMIWVNLVVAVLGGLALLTEPPSQKLMEKPPIRPSEPFITNAMWRNIIIQASYQVSILLAFQFKGQAILNINEEVSKTMIFNSFLLCQLSNQFNASEQKLKNLGKGIQQNLWFWVASVLTVVLQVVFIEISHHIFGFARLNGPQWSICFLIGALSWVTDGAVNLTWGVIKGKLTRPSSQPPRSTGILELPLRAENSSPTAS
jgi:Ca2+-transporting ATPase